jgi:hypothetical protein
MRKSVILVAAVALSVAVPSIVSQAQAAPAKHRGRHVTRVVQQAPAPARNPLCDNGYNKQNMNWQEYYHCYRH